MTSKLSRNVEAKIKAKADLELTVLSVYKLSHILQTDDFI